MLGIIEKNDRETISLNSYESPAVTKVKTVFPTTLADHPDRMIIIENARSAITVTWNVFSSYL